MGRTEHYELDPVKNIRRGRIAEEEEVVAAADSSGMERVMSR